LLSLRIPPAAKATGILLISLEWWKKEEYEESEL